MEISGERDFKKIFKKLIVFGNQNRSLQDILLVYVFFSMVVLVSISTFINIIIGISLKVIVFDFIVIGGFLVLYILANISDKIKLIRRVFVLFSLASVVFLWINSEGSSGPSIMLLQSLAVIFIFISTGKEFVFYFVSLVFLTISLYIFELYDSHMILDYNYKGQKIFDNLSMVLLIFAFQIPVLTYARNVLFKDREEAISNAEEKSCFLAQMSHEIRTPMNAILGFVELLDDPTIDKEEHSTYLKIINQNSRVLLNLLNNAININQINSGHTQVFISKCNANKIVKHVADNLIALSSNSKVKVEVLENKLYDSFFEVDDNLLYQILINVGYNALKFTKEGSVSLSWIRENDNLIFSIRDTGCGIAEIDQSDLFDKYIQTQNIGGTTPLNGVGLGLHICKKITDLLNGEIWFSSKVNVGTEFFIKLPVVALKKSV